MTDFTIAVCWWLWNALISLDQLANVLLAPLLNLLLRPRYRFGFPDETLSSVLGKNSRAGSCRFCRWVCRLLNRVDPAHCDKNIESDEGDK